MISANVLKVSDLNNWTTIQGDSRKIDPYALFINYFECVPSGYHFNSFSGKDEKLNRSMFYDKIVEFFNKNEFEYIYSTNNPLVRIDHFGDETEEYYTHTGINVAKKIVVYASSSYVSIYFAKECYFKEEVREIIESCIEKRQFQKKVHLVTQDSQGYFDLTECKVGQVTPVDINKHYNDDFKPEYDKMIKFLSERTSGLMILHGVPGTGKTNMIRHFINTYPNQYIILSNSLMNAISSPAFLSFMLENKNSVLILEDCEMLLADRTTSRFADGINNILNMTDGLYSDILNIKIIATFNSDMTSIDKALLRDGRLISKYEFKELSIDKTNTLLKELGKGESDKPLTLAEIYNKTSEEIIQVKKPKRIGF